ncbi:EmrB/QacA subfamily drug resistance transporter [Streptomyces achromogenes]|uniref:EmrB/QacA subfamily drug resistance transporter n=1 Tax=Streptomyces achromogenes TaxID=67255 RepID=A0ABU0PS99_STRAH|nr:MFS transporter [Streptomyces achromogenes]MDQ0681250.1 EmrB/QacA subfamily drug resistance transporter [Streptomyces achromogenes]
MSEPSLLSQNAGTEDTATAVRHPGVTLAVIISCQLMIVVATTVVNIALPGIREDLGFSPTDLSWVVNAYMLTFGGLLLLGGRCGDLLGRRAVFLTGIAIFTACSLLAALAPTAPVLLAALVGQGLGAALAEPTSLAMLATTFAEGPRRNRALGAFSTVAGAGTAVGMILGGLLSLASWRWTLFLNVPIGIAVLLVTPRFVAESERRPGRFDLAGALTSTAGMAALVNTFIQAQSHGWTDQATLLSGGAAMLLLAIFVVVELRAEQPVVPLRLLARRERAAAYADTLLVGATVSGLFFFLTQFLQTVLGYSGLRAGFGFLPLAVLMVVSAVAAPRLLTRLGARPLLVVGAAVLGAGTFWFSRITEETGYASGLAVPLALVGLGLGLTIMPLNSIILAGVSRGDTGAASGLQQAMLRVGASLGLALLVTAGGGGSGAHRAPAPGAGHGALVHSIETGFTVATGFVLCALVLGLTAFRKRSTEPARNDN